MTHVIQLALPVPLPRLFDYDSDTLPTVGARVRVPFGNRKLVGVFVGEATAPDNSYQRKNILEILDSDAVWPEPLWRLLNWAADYYHHPLGDVIQNALPVLLRQGERASYQATTRYQITPEGAQVELNSLKRAVQQQRLMAALQQNSLLSRDIRMQELSASALKAVQDKGWVEAVEHVPAAVQSWQLRIAAEPLQLNPEQALAVAAIGAARKPQTYLLEGVTG